MLFDDLSPILAIQEQGDLAAAEALIRERPASYRKPGGRSALMVSANRPKHLNKLRQLAADVAVVNLEDGVSPEEKPMAARMAALFISRMDRTGPQVVVRVNPLGEGAEEEIALFNKVKPDAIRIPKIHTPEEVERACSLIDPSIAVHLSIETKEAWQNLERLRTEERVDTFYLGVLDLLVSLELPQSVVHMENPTIQYILSRFLVATKATGARPVSFVYQDYEDLSTFRDWCMLEKEMGYRSKGCISPKQAEVANQVFSPSKREIARAEKIVQLFEEQAAAGVTGFSDPEFGFIDEPIYKGARVVLKAAGK